MTEEEIRKMVNDTFNESIMNNLDSSIIFKYIQELEKENQKLRSKLDCVLKLLSEIYLPCDIDGFMDKYSDYCTLNCGVDEEVFKKCWLLYIEEKLKEVK